MVVAAKVGSGTPEPVVGFGRLLQDPLVGGSVAMLDAPQKRGEPLVGSRS